MKIKLSQILTLSYLILAFILLKKIEFIPIILFAAAFFAENFTNLKAKTNLLYVLAALSVFPTLLWLFLLYLPFAVFGSLLAKKSFVRSYIFGFAVSFIPTTLMYLASTYFSVPLSLPIVFIAFYSLPLIAVLFLKRKSIEFFELHEGECIAMLIILGFATIVAINVLDEKNLFIANGVREFVRLQAVVQGLKDYGEFVTYNPAIAQGEATLLWNSPSFYANISLATFMLGNAKPILFFNFVTFFILFLSAVSLLALLSSIANKEESGLNMLALAAIAVTVGLNFFFLQLLESFKQYYAFPVAYLLLAMILDNPKTFREFVTLMYLSLIIMMVHLAYGAGVNVIGICLFLIIKSYCIKDKSEIKHFFKWLPGNKLKVFAILIAALLLPLFYITPGFIYKDFFLEGPKQAPSIMHDLATFWEGFFQNYISILSVRYPDVRRIDDHKAGFFISVFGVISLLLLIVMYKIKSIKNYRIFAFGFLLNILILSFITEKVTVRLGGFYRTTPTYLLILMGASILTLILLVNRKIIKLALIAAVFLAFIHAMPYAKQNLSNIHVEQFAGGDVYQNEINFIRQLPIDGRIMTYGLFSNAVDFGGQYLTGRYFSRNERIELAIDRTVFEKIHGQNSFGQEDLILPKSGAELHNYLALGGYKYLFMNIGHPISQHVFLELSPSFARRIYQNLPQGYLKENRTDYAYPIYQNGPLMIFIVNNTNYAEKVNLVKWIPEGIYKQKNGYRYVTISPYYNFDKNLNFADTPKEPEPLGFERASPTKVRISGNFNDNDFVVFKEQYFPRWKAYMNGKEVPVYANNHDLILIRASKGSNILLEYSVLGFEKFMGAMSFAGFLGLALMFLILAKSGKID